MPTDNEILFLGTGAAQGIPALYSPRMAEKAGDTRNVRSRSSIRVSPTCQIDAGPDAWYQLLREQQSWDALEHLFISHTHSDHLYLEGILQKQNARDHDQKQLCIYLSEPALDWTLRTRFFSQHLRAPSESDIIDLRASLEEKFAFQTIAPWEIYTVADTQVSAIPGTHSGRVSSDVALNYIFELSSGFRLLYGVDTGYYPKENFEFLSHTTFDLIVLDCTFGARADRGERPHGHLDCHSLVGMVRDLDTAGCLKPSTKIYATHINPDQGWSHKEMDAFFATTGYPIRTAWDGLRVGTDLALS